MSSEAFVLVSLRYVLAWYADYSCFVSIMLTSRRISIVCSDAAARWNFSFLRRSQQSGVFRSTHTHVGQQTFTLFYAAYSTAARISFACSIYVLFIIRRSRSTNFDRISFIRYVRQRLSVTEPDNYNECLPARRCPSTQLFLPHDQILSSLISKFGWTLLFPSLSSYISVVCFNSLWQLLFFADFARFFCGSADFQVKHTSHNHLYYYWTTER